MTLTRIVSLKEGHDESHIDETKLGKKFWNIVDNVTIVLTQSIDTKVVFTTEVNFLIPLNIERHDKRLGSMNRPDRHTMRQWTMHSFERLKGVT